MTESQTSHRRPVRVLQLLPCDDYAGTELMVAQLIERLDPARVACEFATLSGRGPIGDRLEEAGVPVYSLGADGQVRAFWRLVRLLRRRDYDVVNAYGFKAGMSARLLARLVSDAAPVVGVRGLHVTDMERIGALTGRLTLLLERSTSRFVRFYDANSRGAVEVLASNGVDRERLRYIANGIDLSEWPPRNGSGPRRPTILCVARFSGLKRHVDLVEALARLDGSGVPVRAVLVGDGPLLPDVRRTIASVGLDSVIDLPGQCTPAEIPSYMSRADIFCLPSLWEGMPGSVMEAMASGIPVVGTAVNGIEDLVVDEVTGLLVPPRRPDLLAAALERLITNPDERELMGSAGRARVASEFSLDSMIEAKERLYLSAARS